MARLLIVDDNEDNRNMLSRRLARREHDVAVAADGPAALRALAEGPPFDAVLLDVMMPGMSGTEVLAEIRKRFSRLELPVIMATARAETEHVVEALSLGANDYVTKPIDFPILLARLTAVMQVRDSHRQSAAPPDTSTLDHIGPGTVLHGRYELVRPIGSGGFAIVYEAVQRSTGQRVALKILYEDMIDEVQLARFEREMQIIGQLRHPHVVKLIDCGHVRTTTSVKSAAAATDATRGARPQARDRREGAVAHPVPYIVMELLEGESLHARLERMDGGYPVAEAIDVLLPVLSAVASAHAQEIVHRDLKPANIFLARGPGASTLPVVLDFGIAKPKGGDAKLSLPSQFIGTPQYMAPEQALGLAHVDARSDQYSFGIVLFEAMAGRSPFAGKTFFQVVHAVTTGAIPTPSSMIAELPDGLEAVMMRALSVAAADRYPSMQALGEALLPYASERGRAQWAPAIQSGSIPPPPSPGSAAMGALPTVDVSLVALTPELLSGLPRTDVSTDRPGAKRGGAARAETESETETETETESESETETESETK